MRDEKDELLDELFRRARLMKPDTERLEEHFETRIMAAMDEKRRERDLWSSWTWRLVPWLTIIVLAVGIGSVAIEPARSGDLFATFTGDDDAQITNMLAGG